MVKTPPVSAGHAGLIPGSGRSPGQEDPLGKGLATRSSILAWAAPWTEEPGGLQCTGLQRAGRDQQFIVDFDSISV